MSDLRKAAEQYIRPGTVVDVDVETTAILVDLLRQALAQPEWVGLTDEDLEPMCDDWRIVFGPYVHDFAKAIEAKLKEKNGG